MPTPERDRAILRTFLARAELALDSPIIALRDPERDEIAMQLTYSFDRNTRQHLSTELKQPMLDRRTIDSCIVDCRVFFHTQETCYLPSVVKALRRLVTQQRAQAMMPLAKQVGDIIRDGGLVGSPRIHSGRLEMDNGVGQGLLLGGDQIAMDYINGVAFHQDDERVARLANTSGPETIAFAVILQLDQLLYVVQSVRTQILHDIEKSYVNLDS
ncbi:hypothetical protein [Agreia sp. COWG]|uniref:hypothetical protein n=1 Tax=Agreia sp. COWG TaxID=2773266 RepID=UPI0019264FD9|nr:hypothetical protein [Agreia sp. COWG]CAD6005315.1 conserved protein of unknown function [Agreia sp. COWG]